MLQRQDLPMPVINSIAAAEDEMTAWRRDFHMHPELGFEEFRTSETVANLLESWGIEVTRGIAGTGVVGRSEEHTSELQSLMRISYAVFCLKKKTPHPPTTHKNRQTHQVESHLTTQTYTR